MNQLQSEIRERLQGPINSVPVAFSEDGQIDYAGVARMIDRSLEAGCGVVMLTWGNSLMSLLTDGEVADVHAAVARQVAGRALTVACDNMWGLPKCVEFGRHVRELGFDLYMVRPPIAMPGTPESLAAYYTAVADEIPVMLVGDVPFATCEALARVPGVCAFKEDASLGYAHEMGMRWGDRWTVAGGGGLRRHHLLAHHEWCPTWLDYFVCSHPAPAFEYWSAVRANDGAAAWEHVTRWELPLRDYAAATTYGWDGLVRHALPELFATAPRWRRSPAPNPSDAEMAALREFLEEREWPLPHA